MRETRIPPSQPPRRRAAARGPAGRLALSIRQADRADGARAAGRGGGSTGGRGRESPLRMEDSKRHAVVTRSAKHGTLGKACRSSPPVGAGGDPVETPMKVTATAGRGLQCEVRDAPAHSGSGAMLRGREIARRTLGTRRSATCPESRFAGAVQKAPSHVALLPGSPRWSPMPGHEEAGPQHAGGHALASRRPPSVARGPASGARGPRGRFSSRPRPMRARGEHGVQASRLARHVAARGSTGPEHGKTGQAGEDRGGALPEGPRSSPAVRQPPG